MRRSRTCKLCGELFEPASANQNYCNNEHFAECVICGNKFKITHTYHKATCGSSMCVKSYRAQTNLQRFGVDNPAKSQVIKDKQAQTCLDRYGVLTPFQMVDFQQKSEQTSLSRYGVKHPMQADEIQAKHRQSVQSHFGVDTPTELPHVREALKTVHSDTARMKTIASKRTNSANCIASDGTHLDSHYELDVYEFCLRNNLPIERQVPIEYEYANERRVTFIDFKISDQLFECKGGHLLEGCFDHCESLVPIEEKLKVYKTHDVVIITDDLGKKIFGKPNSTESNGLKYKVKCPEPLIGVDIELFKNPKFPYRDDRPECFYDVKVDGQVSAHDAFYDESIRWKMILNRIQYSGGFIDGTQVVTALNVTRTCKQPSWFSKELAKKLISAYCSHSTIVDPFAGWGARCDACQELHRIYIGGDFNPELVHWHHSKGRDNIRLCDAKDFKFDGSCSVFICPPYSDPETGRCFEDYNFEGFDLSAKALTQCDWLKIVMKNIPNATEYVMVCKIVDDDFRQFVVDTKINKSHFGINNEYIVVVPNAAVAV